MEHSQMVANSTGTGTAGSSQHQAGLGPQDPLQGPWCHSEHPQQRSGVTLSYPA